MKAYRETIRKYYKYVDWVQPILTENGVMGGNSFACSASTVYGSYYPYLAFDGDGSVDGWHSQQGTPQWLSWYNPEKLSISSIAITNTHETGSPDTFKNYEVQVSDDNSTWKTIYSGTNTTGAKQTWIIDLSDVENYSNYFRIYITSFNNRNYGRAALVNITAKILSESSELDYDVYEDVDIYKLPTKTIPRYLKYNYTHLTTLPTYASAAEGEQGKDGISFTPSAMYFCVARSNRATVTNSYDYKVVWDFGGREFKLTSCTYSGYVVNLRVPYANLNQIEGSNDKEIWDIVTVPSKNFYKFYRFKFVGSETNRYGGMGMEHFNLTGVFRQKIVSTNDEPVTYDIRYFGMQN